MSEMEKGIKTTSKKINVLDSTIRDGSYLIKYQFTAEDTFLVASSLSCAGIMHIEVGHGLGLDAQYQGNGEAASSDIEYIQAAVSAVSGDSKIGVFFIPGIGKLDSIRAAADAGLDFIRVGTNIERFEAGQEAIELSKSLRLEVWGNLMKSYVVTPDEFSRVVKEVEELGADIVALVDSAGGMTPNQVRVFAQAGLAKANIPLAFHGHNNLELVIANCLAFIEEGGTYVDGTLRGMGRSAGNAATELLCALFDREGYDIGDVDWEELVALGHRLIAPNVPRDIGLDPDEIASGLRYFHSSFQPLIDESSDAVGVASYRTILRLGPESQKFVTEEMARKAAKEALPKDSSGEAKEEIVEYKWLNRDPCKSLPELLSNMKVLSSKTGYDSVLTLSRPSSVSGTLRIAPVRIGSGYCIGHVEVPEAQESAVVDVFKDEIRLWMVDTSIQAPGNIPKGSNWLQYSDDILLLGALRDWIQIASGASKIYLPESKDNVGVLAHTLFKDQLASLATVGVAISNETPFSVKHLDHVVEGGHIIVCHPGAITAEAICDAHRKGLLVSRLDLGEALISEVARVFDSAQRLRVHTGRREVAGICVVAGGVVGEKGDLIVNSIATPTTIIGKADGTGGVAPLTAYDNEAKERVIKWILQSIGNSI